MPLLLVLVLLALRLLPSGLDLARQGWRQVAVGLPAEAARDWLITLQLSQRLRREGRAQLRMRTRVEEEGLLQVQVQVQVQQLSLHSTAVMLEPGVLFPADIRHLLKLRQCLEACFDPSLCFVCVFCVVVALFGRACRM